MLTGLGHTYVIHLYISEYQPTCTACQAAIRVKQILTECTHLTSVGHGQEENNTRKLYENAGNFNLY